MPATYHLHVLGRPRLRTDDGDPVDLPLGKPFALLCYVVLAPGRVTRSDLCTVFWPSSPRDRARASLRQALWMLRKTLDDDAILTEEEEVRARDGAFELDLVELEEALARDDPEHAWELWAGGPLTGFSVADAPEWNYWQDEFRSRLERRMERCLRRRAELLAEAGRREEALEWVDRALEVRPYLESARVLKVRLLLELHRLDDAAAALDRARSVVDGPDPELFRELEERLAELRKGRFEAPDEPGLTTEFVGRSHEFSTLVTHWRSALSGRPRSVVVLGPTGVGKTRLAEEFLTFTRSEGARVVDLRAVPAERNLELGAVAEVAKQLHRQPGAAGISNASHAALRKLLPTLRPVGADDATGDPRSTVLADAMLDLLRAVAHEGPLVLFVDDFQWIDEPSRTLLTRVCRTMSGSPFLLLATCRSGDEDPGVVRSLRDLQERKQVTLVELEPLGNAEVRELLTLLAEFESTEAMEVASRRIYNTSRGNPLFLVELLQNLRQDRVLVHVGEGRWSFEPRIWSGQLPLPSSLRQLLERRVELLSPETASVAAALARSPGPRAPSRLLAEAGRTPSEDDAIRELLDAGVVRWSGDDEIDFVHGEVRKAVARRLAHPSSPLAARRWWWAAAAAAVVVLAVGGLAWSGGLIGADRPGARYGGGSIFLGYPDETVELRPPQGGGVWTEEVRLPATGGVVRAVQRAPDGSVRRFGHRPDPARPLDLVEVGSDGSTRTLVSVDGDALLYDVSPDGRYAVVGVEAPGTEPPRIDLHRLDLETGERVRIVEGRLQAGASPQWSGDGRFIVLGRDAAHDSILVVQPDGDPVVTVPGPEPDTPLARWCGGSDRLLVGALPPGRPLAFHLLEVPSGRSRPVELAHPVGGGIACSPDGRAVVYAAALDSRRRVLVVEELGTGATTELPVSTGRLRSITWQPTRPMGVPVDVEVGRGPTTMLRGERSQLEARVTFSEGRPGPGTDVRWASRDPGVVSVSRDGLAAANGPGTTWVVVEAHGWLSDSVRIGVEPGPTGTRLLDDGFTGLDTTVWKAFGSRRPTIVTAGGEQLLSLDGDGTDVEGLASARAYTLQRGGTLEVEFRLPLTDRRDRQRISICLVEPPDAPATPELRPDRALQRVCFGYPAQEMVDFDPTEFQFDAGLTTGPVSAPEHLPTDGWTRVALQLRPDGRAALFLNGRFVSTSALRVLNGAETRWRVVLQGHSVDTEALVRRVTLWGEERYTIG